MGSISTKSAAGGRKKAEASRGCCIENEPIPSISIINYEQSSSYTETSAEPNPHPTELSNQFEPDQAVEVDDVGGMTVNNEELRRVIEEGRKEIKDAQEKLNSSLTTPITESEAKVDTKYHITNLESGINVVVRLLISKKLEDV